MIILGFIVIALVAGFAANWLVGRKRKYENWELFVVGVLGSFVGGLIFNLIAGNGFEIHWTGLLGSILGATVLLAIYGPFRSWLRKRQNPGPTPDPLAERHHKR